MSEEIHEEIIEVIEVDRGKVDLDRKLLRRNSPFLPYSIRIEILEYIEMNISYNWNLFNSFGYFAKDPTRLIYQVFRCFQSFVRTDTDCDKIPTANTISVKFFVDWNLEGKMGKRKFSCFRNLKMVDFNLLSVIEEKFLLGVGKIPKLKKLALAEKGTNGLIGLENISNHPSLETSSNMFVEKRKEGKNIDYFKRKLHLVKSLRIENHIIKVKDSLPCDISNESVALCDCIVGGDLFQFLGNNNKGSLKRLKLKQCRIEPLESLFNEKTIFLYTKHKHDSANKHDKGIVLSSYRCTFSRDDIELPYFRFFWKPTSTSLGSIGVLFMSDLGQSIVLPDDMIELLNSFHYLSELGFGGKIEFEELVKIKCSSLELICFRNRNVFDISKNDQEERILKKNNPKLNKIYYHVERMNELKK